MGRHLAEMTAHTPEAFDRYTLRSCASRADRGSVTRGALNRLRQRSSAAPSSNSLSGTFAAGCVVTPPILSYRGR